MGELTQITVQAWESTYDDEKTSLVDKPMAMCVLGGEPRPLIDLYEIDANRHDIAGFDIAAYQICQQIVDEHFPGQAVTDFDWRHTASGAQADIVFDAQDDTITGYTISNDLGMRYGFATDVATYENALKQADPLNTLSDGYPERYQGQEISKIVVPLPLHPAGSVSMEPPYSDGIKDGRQEIVLVQSDALWELMFNEAMTRHGFDNMDQMREYYENQPSKGDDTAFPPFHGALEDSLSHINPGTGYPKETPVATYFKKSDRQPEEDKSVFQKIWDVLSRDEEPEEELAFVNGRHRTMNLIKLGAPYVPILMTSGQRTEEFKQKYAWGVGDVSPPAFDNNEELKA